VTIQKGADPERFAGWYASPEYRTFSFIFSEALPQYMSAVVKSPWFYSKLADLTRGVGARRERTRPEAFLEMKIPMPTIEQQRPAMQTFEKLERVRKMQFETLAELDAPMPSVLAKAVRGDR
jgi:type I restriction enzyme S subunit